MWPRFNPNTPARVYWLQGPREVALALSRDGFHFGEGADSGCGTDDILEEVSNQSAINPVQASKLLSEWETRTRRRCDSMPIGHATIWRPSTGDAFATVLRQHFRERLEEIHGQDVSEALHAFRLTRWNFGVIYHVAFMGNWREVVREQLDLLSNADITWAHVSLLGSQADREEFECLAGMAGVEIDIRYHTADLKMFEIPAMRLLEDWAWSREEGYVLYFHTKGVSAPESILKRNWRRLMGDRVITAWRENCDHLNSGIDAVGVNWREVPPLSHFPGNFFLARASFLRKLEDFSVYYRNPRHCKDSNYYRIAAEFWIGSGERPPNVVSLFSRDELIDHSLFWINHADSLPFHDPETEIYEGKIKVSRYYVGHGGLGTGGSLGYEGKHISCIDDYDEIVSAHAPSELTVELGADLWVSGILNSTAKICTGVAFTVDGEQIGECYDPYQATARFPISKGVHKLRAIPIGSDAYAHSLWGFSSVGDAGTPKQAPTSSLGIWATVDEEWGFDPLLAVEWLRYHLELGVTHFYLNWTGKNPPPESLASFAVSSDFAGKLSLLSGISTNEGIHGVAKLCPACEWLAVMTLEECIGLRGWASIPDLLVGYQEVPGVKLFLVERRSREPNVFRNSHLRSAGERFFTKVRFIERISPDGTVDLRDGIEYLGTDFGSESSLRHCIVVKGERPTEIPSRDRKYMPEQGKPSISGFIHVAIAGHWRSVLEKQLRKVQSSGLASVSKEVRLGIVGGNQDTIREINRIYPWTSPELLSPDLKKFEFPTLEKLELYSREADGFVWYIHSKGVTNPHAGQMGWRNRMEQFVIANHSLALEKLAAGYRVAAALSSGDERWPVPGNFWWASCEHIRSLPPISSLNWRDRWQAEHWITKSDTTCFYWDDCGDYRCGYFEIVDSRAWTGRASVSEHHSWAPLCATLEDPQPSRHILSAHAPSEILLKVAEPCRVFGAMCETSRTGNWLVEFSVNGNVIEELAQAGQRTPLRRLDPGLHTLTTRVVHGEPMGAHSLWGLDNIPPPDDDRPEPPAMSIPSPGHA